MGVGGKKSSLPELLRGERTGGVVVGGKKASSTTNGKLRKCVLSSHCGLVLFFLVPGTQ